MKKLFLSSLTLGVLLFSSCNKNENSSTPTSPSNAPPKINAPSDADGIMGVVKSVVSMSTPSYPGVPAQDYEIEMGLAFASFFDNPGSGNLVDAGNITCQDSVLEKVANHAYNFAPKGAPSTDGAGIATTLSRYSWNVSGGSSVSAFTYNSTLPLPKVERLNSSKDVNTSEAYTASLSVYPLNCDSIVWLMAGPNGSVVHIRPAGGTSYTFTAAEVGSLGKGDGVGMVQAAPFKLTPFTKNGKKYYHVTESCVTMMVNLK